MVILGNPTTPPPQVSPHTQGSLFSRTQHIELANSFKTQKSGIIGFTKTTAREGAKYDIYVNAVAPAAGTDMTRTVWTDEQVQAIKPEFVAPLVAVLCSEHPPANGGLFEAGSAAFMAYRWQRSRGVDFEHAKGPPGVEDVAKVCFCSCYGGPGYET